ncbi:MAG: hypothetical protein ACR2JB_06755 [Bryobacteraceae bacterium]
MSKVAVVGGHTLVLIKAKLPKRGSTARVNESLNSWERQSARDGKFLRPNCLTYRIDLGAAAVVVIEREHAPSDDS